MTTSRNLESDPANFVSGKTEQSVLYKCSYQMPTMMVHIPGTMTSSFFLVRSLSSLTSSSASNPSTIVPAAPTNAHTILATSSASFIPPPWPLLFSLPSSLSSKAPTAESRGYPLSVLFRSLEGDSAPFGVPLLVAEIRPVVRTMQPSVRESTSVDCTPGF